MESIVDVVHLSHFCDYFFLQLQIGDNPIEKYLVLICSQLCVWHLPSIDTLVWCVKRENFTLPYLKRRRGSEAEFLKSYLSSHLDSGGPIDYFIKRNLVNW